MSIRRTKRVSEFERFYNEHLESVVRYVTRRCDGSEAADVVAEVFSVAWRRFDDLAEVDDERLWLYGVGRRVLANARRSSYRRQALAERLHSEWVEEAAPAASVRLEPLRLAFGQLSDGEREVLMLTGVEELTPAEIAVVIGASPQATRTRLSRARSRLRTLLTQHDSDTPAIERTVSNDR